MAVIYSAPNEYVKIDEAREHLCGYYSQKRACINAEILVDSTTGHQVCSSCSKTLARSGLRLCDMCNCQFINTDKFYDPRYEVNCPRCVIKYELD